MLGLLVLVLVLPRDAAALDLQGHRGARALAPENTLAGFDRALQVGVNTLELDVGVSRDGVLVISHDPRLNPDLTRDDSGQWLATAGPPLISLSLEQLRRYDVGRIKPGTRYALTYPEQRSADGERMPTLDDLFELVAARGAHSVRFNIETKLTPTEPDLTPPPEAFAALIVQTLRRHGMAKRATVQSFDWRTLLAVQQLAPEVVTAALTVRQRWLDNLGDGRWTAGLRLADHGQSVPRLVKAAGARVWSPFHGELSAELVAEAQALGLQVVPWTVNEPGRMHQLLDWRVDGLITDHPDRARRVMAERGLPLPPAWPAR
jgi:glycerophosphoryl diester phosphodiesterase